MSLGLTPPSADLQRSTRELCEPKLSATSIYRLLAEQGHRLFADEAFADLFEDVGRRSVPPRIVATVMVLQRIEGGSDREAVDHFAFDLRWKYAAGVDLDYPAFVHTVLRQPGAPGNARGAPATRADRLRAPRPHTAPRGHVPAQETGVFRPRPSDG